MWPGTIPFTVSRTPNPGTRSLYYACGVNGFNIPVRPFRHFFAACHFFAFQLPSGFRSPVDYSASFMPVRKTQAGVAWSASLLA